MSSRLFLSRVYELDEVGGIDQPAKTFSHPLLKKVGDEVWMLAFVHIYSDTTPTDYVVCKLGRKTPIYMHTDPEYMSADEAYALLQMRREDILSTDTEGDGLATGYDTGKTPADIPDEIYDRFDAAVFGERIDWDAYRDYVKELITYTDTAGKRYLKAFM